jgi:hypothetical protein
MVLQKRRLVWLLSQIQARKTDELLRRRFGSNDKAIKEHIHNMAQDTEYERSNPPAYLLGKAGS